MSYLCQDCKSNNNGWCSVKKCNGLKKLNISYCNKYEGKNTIEFVNGSKIETIKGESTRGKRADYDTFKELECVGKLKNENTVRAKRIDKKDNYEAHRVLGKRQMLWNIQMQVVAINRDVPAEQRYNALVKCLKSFAKMQDFEENLYGVDSILESVIDSDMIEQSKYINTVI